MVHTLYSSGANNIWEHTLLDPSVAKTERRKPHPKDPVQYVKDYDVLFRNIIFFLFIT